MIQAENLTRKFGKNIAVNDVSFHIPRGQAFGFLGHNGAGKTTTIRMLTGQLRPTSGHGKIAGFDIVRQRAKIHPLIGVVFEHQNMYEKLSGRDNLRLFADLHGVNHRRVDELLDLVGLASRAKDKVKKYSNGMRQRLLIARALVNNPQLLFLDEPTRGLDPTSAREIRRTIKTLCQAGTTVFLTTHYMDEADQLCQYVAFITDGKIVVQDTPQNLKLQYGERRARVLLQDRTEHTLALDTPEDAARLQTWMAAGQLLTVHSEEATLEDVFIQLAGRPKE